MNKKLLLIAAAMILPLSAYASTFKHGPEFILRQHDAIAGDLYTAGRTLIVDGSVQGDLVAAGNNMLVSGQISQSVLAAGGTISISGAVSDDVRMVGGDLVIGGFVGGDVVVAGADVHILPDAVITGDLIAAGGRVLQEGRVGGNMKAAGKEVRLDGPVGGDADIAVKELALGPKSVIGGHLLYRSAREAAIDPSAQVQGGIEFKRVREYRSMGKGVFGDIAHGIFSMIKLAIALFSVFVLVRVFGKRADEMKELAYRRFGWNVLTGFVVLVVVPVAIVLAAFTILGMFFAALGALWYAVMLAFSWALTGVLAGSLLWKHVMKKEDPTHWRSALTGVVTLRLVGVIPFFGGLIQCFFFLWSFGTLAEYWYERVWKTR